MHTTDPFATALGGSAGEEYPNAKRNLLEDLNSAGAEQTVMLPPPPQKENISVYLRSVRKQSKQSKLYFYVSLVRVKPITAQEKEIASGFREADSKSGEGEETVHFPSEFQVNLTAPRDSQTFKNSVNGVGRMQHHFTFSRILKPQVGQTEIFASLVCPKVKDFLGGQNQLLFTYGATSAGKTWTMQGEHGNSGIIPRSIDTIFNTIGSKVSDTSVQPSGFNRVVSISQAEQEQQRNQKQSVFRLGLDLQKKSRPPSPDTSVLSGCR